MPEPLLGNESGNWNPSDLFGTVIILLRLDFIIQYSANDEFLHYDHFCIFILFGVFSSCIVVHLESSEWDKVEGL